MSLFGHFSDQVWDLRRFFCGAAGAGVVKKTIEKKVKKKAAKKSRKVTQKKRHGPRAPGPVGPGPLKDLQSSINVSSKNNVFCVF